MKCSYQSFLISKYWLFEECLIVEGAIGPNDILEPRLIKHRALNFVHATEYLGKLQSARLSSASSGVRICPGRR